MYGSETLLTKLVNVTLGTVIDIVMDHSLKGQLKEHAPVKQNAYSACETDSISACEDYSAKVGGNVPEKQSPVSSFIEKMKKLEQLILSKYEGHSISPQLLIEILF